MYVERNVRCHGKWPLNDFRQILLQLTDVTFNEDLLSSSGELRAHRQRKEQMGSFNNRSEES